MKDDNSSHWLDRADSELNSAKLNISAGESQYRSAALALQKAAELAIKAVQVSLRGTNNHDGGHDLQQLAAQTKQDIQNNPHVDDIHASSLTDKMSSLVILSNVKEKAEYPDDADFSSFNLDPNEYFTDVAQLINWARGFCQNNRY